MSGPATDAIAKDVERLLWAWEKGDMLYSEAAQLLVGVLIGHELIVEALAESKHGMSQPMTLVAVTDQLSRSDP